MDIPPAVLTLVEQIDDIAAKVESNDTKMTIGAIGVLVQAIVTTHDEAQEKRDTILQGMRVIKGVLDEILAK
jgi:hypothetical protein